MKEVRYFKKGKEYYKEIAQKGNFLLLSDGKWYHKNGLDSFREIKKETYDKASRDEGVGDDTGADFPGATEDAPGDGLYADDGDNDGSGEDGEGEAEPEDATWGDDS